MYLSESCPGDHGRDFEPLNRLKDRGLRKKKKNEIKVAQLSKARKYVTPSDQI